MRIDHLKTSVASDAGPTSVLTPAFARSCGFGVDPCRPACGRDKGKTEHNVRTHRSVYADLFVRSWVALPEPQAALDARSALVQSQRRCPITGTPIAQALLAERALLQPVPNLHELFDGVVARRVSRYVSKEPAPHMMLGPTRIRRERARFPYRFQWLPAP